MIYEKFQSLLIHHPEIFKGLGTIVLDEIQMLIDSRRGRVLELILTEYQHLDKKPQLIGLSSVLSNENPITTWLKIPFFRSDYRPRELRLGVFHEGCFHYRNLRTFHEGYEEIKAGTPEQLAVGLTDVEGQTIIFLPTRKESVNAAEILADTAGYGAAASVIRGMSHFERTAALEKLKHTLKRGIAFHNADFTFDERWIIEQGFRLGEIRILCATTTLALGINLPAKNIILDLNLLTGKRFPNHHEHKPLSRQQFENMGGRAARGTGPAGREAAEEDFGRAILFARSRMEMEVLWETYVSGRAQNGEVSGSIKPSPKTCLQILCLRPESSAEDILAWIYSSFTFQNRSWEDDG
jgi:helicase